MKLTPLSPTQSGVWQWFRVHIPIVTHRNRHPLFYNTKCLNFISFSSMRIRYLFLCKGQNIKLDNCKTINFIYSFHQFHHQIKNLNGCILRKLLMSQRMQWFSKDFYIDWLRYQNYIIFDITSDIALGCWKSI